MLKQQIHKTYLHLETSSLDFQSKRGKKKVVYGGYILEDYHLYYFIKIRFWMSVPKENHINLQDLIDFFY